MILLQFAVQHPADAATIAIALVIILWIVLGIAGNIQNLSKNLYWNNRIRILVFLSEHGDTETERKQAHEELKKLLKS